MIAAMKHKPATLGVPADPALRALRVRAQRTFDAVCNGGVLTRAEADAWLREEMGLTLHEVHIDAFVFEQCQWLIRAIEEGRHLEQRL